MSEHSALTTAPAHAPPQPVGPAADRPESLPELVRALGTIAAAATAAAVGQAAVAGARDVTGARGCALGVRDGDEVRLLASLGYDCDAMAAGAVLPLNAGLPLTEAIRTARVVRQGDPASAAWVAVPVPLPSVEAGLLVSLHPHTDVDVAALRTLARVTGDALARCPVDAATSDDPGRPPAWLRTAVVQEPADRWSGASGDVVVFAPGTTPDVSWLVVADVCGSGADAAEVAARFRETVRALAAADLTPDALLAAADHCLRRDRADRFVTAIAIRLVGAGDRVEAHVATAGHPPALLWRPDRVEPVGTDGLPLNLLELDLPVSAGFRTVTLSTGDLLLVHTDGLVDRGVDDRTDALVTLLASAGRLGDCEAVLEVLTHAMTAATDRPRDDLAAVVIGLR